MHIRNSCRAYFVIALTISISLSTAVFSQNAWAFWFGTAQSDDIVLKDAPNDSSNTIETLPRGARFTSADQPVDGYYRVRTKANTGYISASLIDNQNPKLNPSGGAQATSTASKGKRSGHTRRPQSKWSASLLVGVAFSNPTDVSNAIGSKNLSDPLAIGLELAYRLNNSWRLAFRGEYLSKSLTGTNTSDGNTYQLTMKGYMAMFGADYFITETPRYDIYAGGRVGLGIAQLSSVASNLPSPNETDFSGTTFAGTVQLGADYKAWSFLGFGAEVGYQYFQTGAAKYTTAATNAGAGIWPNPIGLSFSGAFVDVNLRVLF